VVDNKNRSPLVSIVVPSYNHAQFLEQCIKSIFAQTFKDFELIVIDDGSTDNSCDILNHLNRKYDFTFITQENMGLARTFNKGIQQYARGKYFTFCASDDYWLPQKLEKQVSFLEQHPDIPMCYGRTFFVDEKGDIIDKVTKIMNQKYKGGYIFADILLQNFHPPVNYMFLKSIFDVVGYYREDIYIEDYYMNLRISRKYEIGFIEDYLSCYRVSSHFTLNSMKIPDAHLKCINEYKDSEFYKEAIRRWHFRNFKYFAANKKHKMDAVKGMLHSTRYLLELDFLKALIKLTFFWK
jgi:glycosyltransferase involved in cell wall biosynthesis